MKKKSNQTCFYILICSILYFFNFNPTIAQKFVVRNFTTNEGLQSNIINDANFDYNGFLWLATQAGLSRFNGETFQNHLTTNNKEIISNRFTLIEKQKDCTLLVLNQNKQLFLINKKSKLEYLKDKHYGIDFVDVNGNSIYFIPPNKKFSSGFLDSLNKKYFNLYLTDDKSLYQRFQFRLVYNQKTISQGGEHSTDINHAFVIKDRFYILTKSARLRVYYKGTIEKEINISKKIGKKISLEQIYIKRSNKKIVLSIENEIYYLEDNQGDIKLNLQQLTKDNLTGLICIDQSLNKEIKYVFSKYNGIFLYFPQYFTPRLTGIKGISKKDTYRILYDNDNNLYSLPVLKMMFPGKFNEYNPVLYNRFNSQLIYIHSRGYEVIQKNKTKYYPLDFGFDTDDPNYVLRDVFTIQNEEYLISTSTLSKLKIEEKKVETIYKNEGIGICAIEITKNNDKWLIGTHKDGIIVYDLITKQETLLDFFVNKEIRCIKYDKNLDLYWVFTYGTGIYFLNSNFKTITPQFINKERFTFAHYMLQDKLGYYWIPCNSGLVRLHYSQLIKIKDSIQTNIYYEFYNLANGIHNNEFNGSFSNSGIKLANGKLLMSNMDGFLEVETLLFNTKQNEINYNIVIDDIYLNGNSISVNDIITTVEGYKSLLIKVETPKYLNNYLNDIEYLIPELVSEWTPVSSNTLELLSIKKGNYEIFFRKRGDLNHSNYKVIFFTVLPPWYRTNLAFVIYFILLFSIGFYIIRYYFRVKEIKLKKEFAQLESELKALRTQINPHYLSNSLMSLQSIVLENDKEKAFEFIGQYGKVMRNILEKSDYSFISLEQEIQTLNEYIKFEGLIRGFIINFEYTFTSDNPIDDMKNIKVPTMIFQPFVENSILHGLISNNQEVKQIVFVIKIVNKKLQVIITDNGVGYTRKITNRKSYGLENIQNRLKAYSKLLNMNSNFQIEVIKDGGGVILGTKVVINMPYILELETNI